MSHNVEHFTYPEKVNKQKVQAELDDYVAHEDWQEGCTGLFHQIRWLDGTVYKDYQEAHEAIEKLDRGAYDQLAVKYYYHHEIKDQKYGELQDKCAETHTQYESRNRALYAQTVTAAFIGCKSCGSRLARIKLRSNFCPVCGADLRPEHILKSVAAAKNRWDRAQESLKEYRVKKGKKEILWLVKIEYHT